MNAPTPPSSAPGDEYNYGHFERRHLLADVVGVLARRGVRPGSPAPDFELPRVGGGDLRLSEVLPAGPVLLHFGSFT